MRYLQALWDHLWTRPESFLCPKAIWNSQRHDSLSTVVIQRAMTQRTKCSIFWTMSACDNYGRDGPLFCPNPPWRGFVSVKSGPFRSPF